MFKYFKDLDGCGQPGSTQFSGLTLEKRRTLPALRRYRLTVPFAFLRLYFCDDFCYNEGMNQIEQKLSEFEARPALYDKREQARRAQMFQHLAAINKFEGLMTDSIDEKLFALLATGKISKPEYISFCINEARGTVS